MIPLPIARIRLSLLVALAATPLAGCDTRDAPDPAFGAGTVVYEGARLIVGDGSAPIDGATLVVQDGRIVQVGQLSGVQFPDGVVRVDLTGRTVMPAIVDTHKHFAEVIHDRAALVDQLEHLAYYGVAAVLSMGTDEGEVPFRVRDEVIPGAARYLTAGRGITTPEPGRSEAPYWITTEEEARAAVRELARQRVDIVKIWVDDRGGTYERLGPELYTPVIEEAHRHGLRVTAHIFSLEDAKGLLRTGVDKFAHGIRDRDIDDELIALWRERPHVVLVPNLPDRGVATDLSWLAGTVPPDRLSALQEESVDRPAAQRTFDIQARNLARLHREGFPIAFGTDGNVPWAAHLEMEDMVAAGMSPMDVIVAATRNSADLLRLPDVGTLEAGMSADFIVLAADPLQDIRNTRRIEAVYLRGTPIDRESLGTRWRGGQ